MRIQAIIFDIYGTLLQVGPAPPDGEDRWKRLWKETLGIEPPLTRLDFSMACNGVVRQHHQAAHARGIAYPEILWPAIVREVVPQLASVSSEQQEAFILGQIRTDHVVRMKKETAEALQHLKAKYLLGIASNAQAYTLRELSEVLAEHRLSMNLFDPELCFWSFQHGFSKPDPHVFQILSIRLEARGISRNQILAVGDRLDNDIEPARAQGWQTWHLSGPSAENSGGWADLLAAVQERGSAK